MSFRLHQVMTEVLYKLNLIGCSKLILSLARLFEQPKCNVARGEVFIGLWLQMVHDNLTPSWNTTIAPFWNPHLQLSITAGVMHDSSAARLGQNVFA